MYFYILYVLLVTEHLFYFLFTCMFRKDFTMVKHCAKWLIMLTLQLFVYEL